MDQGNVIPYMMSFLKEFNYPLIQSMNTEEISEIFNITNRCFLICWLFRLMDEETYVELLEDREHDIEFLGNLVCNHGFCLDKEKQEFFKGDLPLTEHVNILFRIFNFISNMKKESQIEKVNLSNNMIESLLSTNLNLFPSSGDIRSLSEKQIHDKITTIRKEIRDLELQADKCAGDVKSGRDKELNINKLDKQVSLEDLKNNLFEFDRMVKAVEKNKSVGVKSNYTVDPGSANLLEKCCKNLQLIAQYIEDLNTINTFDIEDRQDSPDNISPFMNRLAEQVQEISKCI